MTGDERTTIRLRLRGGGDEDGEISLDDLASIAEEMQGLVRRLGRGLVGQRGPGRPSRQISSATRLRLVGLHAGSTVLEIAGAHVDEDLLRLEDLPLDLPSRTLALFVDAMSVVALDDGRPLPQGVDAAAAQDMDRWLRSVRHFAAVEISTNLTSRERAIRVEPKRARNRLRSLQPQPALPFVSPTAQALVGTLYALNVHTGTYSVEDDSGHKIRLRLPEELRGDAAMLVTRRVRALGTAATDDTGRLLSFSVSSLVPAPELDALAEQSAFFTRHELQPDEPVSDRTLTAWGIPDLTDEEADDFLAALRQ